MLDISCNFQFPFNKHNITINSNKLVLSPSDDLSVGNRLLTTSDRIKSIEYKLHNLHENSYENNNSLDLVLEEQQIFQIYYTTITK